MHLQLSDIEIDDITCIKKLFNTRHSIREFKQKTVEDNKVCEAVNLAIRCPSACNRQATKVYVIDAEAREKQGYQNEFYADKYLILTGDIRAYTKSEIADWLISTSIFAGYLTLALHAYGIGSCIMRKELLYESDYCKKIRKLCDIP